MTKEEFLLWKKSPYTVALRQAIAERRSSVMESLVQTAGLNVRDDAFKAGYCAALVDAHDIDFEDLEESA